MKIKIPKIRNKLVVPCLFKQAGKHRDKKREFKNSHQP
jgi:hypothetical protein